MTRDPIKPNVCKEVVKGKVYYYFRKVVQGKEHMVRLPDDPDSPEFDREYWAIRTGRKEKREVKTTLNALLSSWQKSARYRKPAVSSQDKYDRHAALICAENGTNDTRKLRRKDVMAMRANGRRLMNMGNMSGNPSDIRIAISAKSLVPEVGLEPTSLAAGDFESPGGFIGGLETGPPCSWTNGKRIENAGNIASSAMGCDTVIFCLPWRGLRTEAVCGVLAGPATPSPWV